MQNQYRPYTTYKSNLRRRPRNEMLSNHAPIDYRLIAVLVSIGTIVVFAIALSI